MGNCACFEGVAKQGGGGQAPRGQTGSIPPPRFLRSLEDADTSLVFSKPSGRRKALLVGINYVGTSAELSGCLNDVDNVRRLLTETFRWNENEPNSEIRALTDSLENRHGKKELLPTRENVLANLQWLVQDARAGDVLFFAYSGHGAQEVDPTGLAEDGMCDTLVPCDVFDEAKAQMIPDNFLTEIAVLPLPEGVSLTVVIDACHSGTAMNLPWTWTEEQYDSAVGADDVDGDHQILSQFPCWRESVNPFFTGADVQMFSGCADNQTSSDGGRDLYNRPGGALTSAFCKILRRETFDKGVTYCVLLDLIRDAMREEGFDQTPQISSSQAFDATTRVFSLAAKPDCQADEVPMSICARNLNSPISSGQIVRKTFSPQPRDFAGSPMGDMLDNVGMLVAMNMLMQGGDGGAMDSGASGAFGGQQYSGEEEEQSNGFQGGGVSGFLGGLLGAAGDMGEGFDGGFDDDDDF